MQHRSEISLMSVVNAAVSAGTGTTTTTGVDCAGCGRVRWLIPITTTLDTGTIAATIHHADANSGYVATTATVTITDAGGGAYDGQLLVIEVAKPIKRWAKLVVVRGVANSALGAMICERYQCVADPTSNPSTAVANISKFNSPATA